MGVKNRHWPQTSARASPRTRQRAKRASAAPATTARASLHGDHLRARVAQFEESSATLNAVSFDCSTKREPAPDEDFNDARFLSKGRLRSRTAYATLRIDHAIEPRAPRLDDRRARAPAKITCGLRGKRVSHDHFEQQTKNYSVRALRLPNTLLDEPGDSEVFAGSRNLRSPSSSMPKMMLNASTSGLRPNNAANVAPTPTRC